MRQLKGLVLAATVGMLVSGTAAMADSVKRHIDLIDHHHTDTYKIIVDAGVTTRISVIGDGGTDLDLYVIDDNGNIVLRDEDNTDNCVVTLTPKWTGPFLIRIVNRGFQANRYMLKVVN
jgi:hypothetical protein